jgi:hypothetical protein
VWHAGQSSLFVEMSTNQGDQEPILRSRITTPAL